MRSCSKVAIENEKWLSLVSIKTIVANIDHVVITNYLPNFFLKLLRYLLNIFKYPSNIINKVLWLLTLNEAN